MSQAAYVVDLGTMAYLPAWELQKQVGQRVGLGALPDIVLLVEHPPVYTLGRAARGSHENLVWDAAQRAKEGIEFVEVDRGGDVTYHGPGQLVGYPIFDLNRHGRDLHRYLRDLEEVLIRTLQDFGIEAGRMPPHTGVWVGHDKVAAIGVKASKWITQHGFALNVDPNLEHFTGIIPCGIHDKGVTSMRRLLGTSITLEQVKPVVIRHLAEVFDVALTPVSLQSLDVHANTV
ncbi:MAG: lipoate-protein ligase B [Sulfobacillus thermosulfidooxidans]|uniref:lipoyl(octanoyl) transferase LipB n=1 Tax=Sulfobacillus TaxID=28033 RepID=UPI000CD27768|nr:lipoyl(octanoyl) transferase LipB [Sulfobacillus sp. hq2]POB12104.1 lipoyl(octanoyl) transferase [Sulfobacillus sp. hq2]PSR37819.1 MAG: lipoate-protein ligase B [Sulfobacillus thermosulfidooxidans]